MSEYGQGTMLLASIVKEKSYTDFSKLKPRIFLEKEIELYKFLKAYVRTFNVLPSSETCEIEGFRMPKVYEPIGYYKKKVMNRYIVRSAKDKLNSEELTKKQDPEDILAEVNSFLKDVTDLDVKERAVAGYESITKATENMLDNRGREGLLGIPTGWAVIDDTVRGIRPGEIMGLIGYTNVGKTFALVDWMKSAREAQKKVLVVSLEMSDVELAERYIANAANVSYEAVVNGNISSRAEKRIRELSDTLKVEDNLVFINGNFDYSLDELILDIKNHTPDIIFIDGLSLMPPDNDFHTRKMGIYEQQAVTAKKLTAVANDTNIAVVYTDQARDEKGDFKGKGKTGKMIKGSGLENVAGSKEKVRASDVVILIYPNPSNPDEELIVKQSKVRKAKARREYLMRKTVSMRFETIKEINDNNLIDDDEDSVEDIF